MVSVFELLARILMTQVGGLTDLQSKLCFRGKVRGRNGLWWGRQWLAELGAEPNYVSTRHEYSIVDVSRITAERQTNTPSYCHQQPTSRSCRPLHNELGLGDNES